MTFNLEILHPVLSQVAAEDKGRYKVRLESNSGDVKWAFVDVNVIQTLGNVKGNYH